MLARMIRTIGIFHPACAVVLCGLAVPAAKAADWKTGAEFRKQLDLPVAVTWKGQTLRPAVRSLAETTGIAIWLDRRLDPDQKLEFTSGAAGERLEVSLQRLAKHVRAGMCQVGAVIYLGPPETAHRLATLVVLKEEEAKRLSGPPRAAILKSVATHWEDLVSPRELLDKWQAETSWQIANSATLPHDLWAAGDWPPLSAIERLTLLLAGFDLTFEFAAEGGVLSLVPLPDEVSAQRVYSVADATGVAGQLKRLFPEAEVKVVGPGKVSFQGSGEQHEQIARMLRGEKVVRAVPGPAATAFTLNIQNEPVGGVAKALAKELGLELKIDPVVEGLLAERVSFRVTNATLDELLTAFTRAAKIGFRREAGTLTLVPAPQP